MPSITPEDLKKIIEQRAILEREAYVAVPLPENTVLMLQIRWWAQYRTYQAVPLIQLEGLWFFACIQMDEPWFRYIKWRLRQDFGIRHIGNINTKNNACRIEQLLGIKQV